MSNVCVDLKPITQNQTCGFPSLSRGHIRVVAKVIGGHSHTVFFHVLL